MSQSRFDVRKYFFAHRIVQCWDSLFARPDDLPYFSCFQAFTAANRHHLIFDVYLLSYVGRLCSYVFVMMMMCNDLMCT